jgi:hypothetical protein
MSKMKIQMKKQLPSEFRKAGTFNYEPQKHAERMYSFIFSIIQCQKSLIQPSIGHQQLAEFGC